MDRAIIASELKEFLEREFPNQGVDLTPSTDLLADWFIDSLGIVETVLFIENNFGIDVGRADINGSNFKSIATLAEFIHLRRAP